MTPSQPQGVDDSKAILGWTVWYTEDRVFRSSTVAWDDLPEDGVLGIVLCEATVLYGRHTRQNLSGYDWYFRVGELYGANNDAPEETRRRYPGARLKRGQWTTATKMQAVTEAMTQEDFMWLGEPSIDPPCGGCGDGT